MKFYIICKQQNYQTIKYNNSIHIQNKKYARYTKIYYFWSISMKNDNLKDCIIVCIYAWRWYDKERDLSKDNFNISY